MAALCVYALALAVRGWRWHRIMRLAEIPHQRGDAYRLTLVGYMGNNVLPARGGEVMRIAMLGWRTTAKRRTILGSIIAERMLDAAVLAALFAVLTWAGVAHAPAGQWPATVAAVGLVLGGFGLAGYLALRRRGYFVKFHEKVGPFMRALKVFAHAEGLLLASLSVLVWCREGVTLLLIGHSLGLELHFLDSIADHRARLVVRGDPGGARLRGHVRRRPRARAQGGRRDGGTAVGFVVLTRFVMFVPVTVVGLFVLLHTYGGLAHARPSSRWPSRRSRRWSPRSSADGRRRSGRAWPSGRLHDHREELPRRTRACSRSSFAEHHPDVPLHVLIIDDVEGYVDPGPGAVRRSSRSTSSRSTASSAWR